MKNNWEHTSDNEVPFSLSVSIHRVKQNKTGSENTKNYYDGINSVDIDNLKGKQKTIFREYRNIKLNCFSEKQRKYLNL